MLHYRNAKWIIKLTQLSVKASSGEKWNSSVEDPIIYMTLGEKEAIMIVMLFERMNLNALEVSLHWFKNQLGIFQLPKVVN